MASLPESPPDARIKSLDGIRALALSSVLISHGVNHAGVELPLIDGTVFESIVRHMGRYGVLVFFVLSGYLITTLLGNEFARTGRISLRKFWFRRALRIFPVFYLFIAVVTLLVLLGVISLDPRAIATAATYTWNYQFLFFDEWNTVGWDTGVLGHLWSLAVEEQFYLLFPLLFGILRPKKALVACVLLIVSAPVVRVAQYYLFPDLHDFGPMMGHTMFGASIAIGCAWALSEHLGIASGVRRALVTTPAFAAALAIVVGVHPLMDALVGRAWSIPIGESLFSFAAMVSIAWVVQHADSSAVGRLLNLRYVAWLGVISYSLYIWHQLLFYFDIPGVPMWVSRLLVLVASLGTAVLSYYLLELPIMRSRERLWARLGGTKPAPAPTNEGVPLPQTAG